MNKTEFSFQSNDRHKHGLVGLGLQEIPFPHHQVEEKIIPCLSLYGMESIIFNYIPYIAIKDMLLFSQYNQIVNKDILLYLQYNYIGNLLNDWKSGMVEH